MSSTVESKWIQNEADERAVHAGCTFSEEKAYRVIDFIEGLCTLSQGEWAGCPFKLMDWQKEDIIMPVFGWQTPEGVRRFKHCYIWVPKKNGKTNLAAAIGLYMLLADGEPGSKVYAIAPSFKQAVELTNEAANIVLASPALLQSIGGKDNISYWDHQAKNITHGTNAWFRCLAAKPENLHGINASCLLIDELHAHQRRTFASIEHAGAARKQSLLITTSTAGESNDSVGYEIYEKSKNILDNDCTDTPISAFAYVKEAPEGADSSDEKVWEACNPSWGHVINITEMRQTYEISKQTPSDLLNFCWLRMNQWVTPITKWINIKDWSASGHDTDLEELKGRECVTCVDLSRSQDLTAVVNVFPEQEFNKKLNKWMVTPDADLGFTLDAHIFMPNASPGLKEREIRDKAPYGVWEHEKWLTICDGAVIDYSMIIDEILKAKDLYDVKDVVFDPWGAPPVQQILKFQHGVETTDARQGWVSMSVPLKQMNRLVKLGKINHMNNPILRFMVQRMKIHVDRLGNQTPDKEMSGGRGIIDGVVAALMGIGTWNKLLTDYRGPSVYETSELLVF